MREISLYAAVPPKGRSLLLAKAISSLLNNEPSERSIFYANDLFSGGRTSDNPLRIIVSDDADLSELERLSAEFGITLSDAQSR